MEKGTKGGELARVDGDLVYRNFSLALWLSFNEEFAELPLFQLMMDEFCRNAEEIENRELRGKPIRSFTWRQHGLH